MTHQSRMTVGMGWILLLSGLVHTAVWIVDGSSLAGPVSWRKPILFGFSGGVTVLSLAWVATQLQPRRRDRVMLNLFGIAMMCEVALITLQQWRGVPSHFNRSTPFDAIVLGWIEGLIAFATLVIVDMTWRSFVSLKQTGAANALAIRGGMAMLLLACLFGFVLVWHGEQQLARGAQPEVLGEAGVVKFPHGMPIHAIQLLPFLVWLSSRLKTSSLVQRKLVLSALVATSGLTLYSVVQTGMGLARWDVSPWAAPFLIAALLGFTYTGLLLANHGSLHLGSLAENEA